MKICIDPGHYGSNYNPGVAAGYVESNFTWDLWLALKEELELYGIEVIGSRASKNDNPGLQARGKTSAGCDLFISLHSNGADNKPELSAVHVVFSMVSGGAGIGQALADSITALIKKDWSSISKPEVYYYESFNHPGQDYYGVLLGAARVGTPAIIVEHSFHTNPDWCRWAMKAGNVAKLAKTEAATIAKFYGIEKPTTSGSDYYISIDDNLKKGDKGDEVKKLQKRMRHVNAEFDKEVEAHSFKNGEPDGSYGGNMVKTVQKFQKMMGLTETGEVDEETRGLLNSFYELSAIYKNGYKEMGDSVTMYKSIIHNTAIELETIATSLHEI